MTASKLRDMTPDELGHEIRELREQLLRLRYQKATAQPENPVRVRYIRRDLARALTIQHEKERAGAAAGSKA